MHRNIRGVLLFASDAVFLAVFVYIISAARLQEAARVSVTIAALAVVVLLLFWAYDNNVQITKTSPK